MRHNTDTNLKAPWREEAKCLEEAEAFHLADAWINENSPLRTEAQRICVEDCPVRGACLVDALFDPNAEGIRAGFPFSSGGLLSKDRRQLEREYPRYEKMARLRHTKDMGISNGGWAS